MNNFRKVSVCILAVLLSLTFTMGMTTQSNTKIAVETVVLSPGNTAPIAENLELTTYRGIAVTGEFRATDSENENIVFEVQKLPKHGEVTVNEDGTFTYDPGDTKRGKDSFTYVAVDASGNRSETATVTIMIEKQKSGVEYTDMKDDKAEYASIYLSEQGIYTGECIGEEYFFNPEQTVSKAEFLAMCLKASEHELLSDVSRTGLVNDDILPTWVKNCVSTAVLCGCFTGDTEFEYSNSITYEEAVVMVDAVFDITDVVSVSAITPYLRDTSAQAMNNLYFCGIADENVISKYDEPLTMRDAALMITAAKEVLNNR